MTPQGEEYFRAGVGALIVNSEGLVLAGERSDVAGAWQAPQGGLRLGEEPVPAVYREVAEETGLRSSDLELLAEYPEWLTYELPEAARSTKTGRGQAQKWFLLRCLTPGDALDLPEDPTAELVRWRWMALAELIETSWAVRQPIYRRLADAWEAFFRLG